MKKLICALLLASTTFAAQSSTPATVLIKGSLARLILNAMNKKPFSGKDITSGGMFSIADAQLECIYRNKNNELHKGTIADYSCRIVDDENDQVYVSLNHALAKSMLEKMKAQNFRGGDSTSGGIETFDNVSAECQQRTKDHELYTGTAADFSCVFTDNSQE